jgi:hypothetical protein
VRWRWWRRPDSARQDIAAAQDRLDAVNAAEPQVSRMVRELRRIQADNSFAARVAAAFKDHR